MTEHIDGPSLAAPASPRPPLAEGAPEFVTQGRQPHRWTPGNYLIASVLAGVVAVVVFFVFATAAPAAAVALGGACGVASWVFLAVFVVAKGVEVGTRSANR
jgi:Flp pilus assembly protein TadB